jgi:hypothetical protein
MDYRTAVVATVNSGWTVELQLLQLFTADGLHKTCVMAKINAAFNEIKLRKFTRL